EHSGVSTHMNMPSKNSFQAQNLVRGYLSIDRHSLRYFSFCFQRRGHLKFDAQKQITNAHGQCEHATAAPLKTKRIHLRTSGYRQAPPDGVAEQRMCVDNPALPLGRLARRAGDSVPYLPNAFKLYET